MKRTEKTGWIIVHIICVCILAFCVWKNRELFPETSVTAGEHDVEGEEDYPVPTLIPSPTEYIEQKELSPTPKPTESVTAPELTDIPEPTKFPDLEEAADPIKDKMGEELFPGTPTPAPQTDTVDKLEGEGDLEKRHAELRAEIDKKIAQGVYEELDNKQYDWWFIRKKKQVPSGSGEAFDISLYDAFYLNKNVSDEDKVIYLTFDCGYENGFTPQILDTLAAHNAKAMFFVTEAFIESRPDYVTRMKEEGHLVGNHTLSHPIMPKKDAATLMDEILGCAELFYETTGYEMDPFLRPPTGAYSKRTLQLTKDLGYTTVFWSIAYKDYDPNNQPGKDYVTDHFKTYYHNGAIPLIHNISKSNTEALDEVLTMLEEAGYRFGSVMELRKGNVD